MDRRQILVGLLASALPTPSFAEPHHFELLTEPGWYGFPELEFKIETVTVKACARALKGDWFVMIENDDVIEMYGGDDYA